MNKAIPRFNKYETHTLDDNALRLFMGVLAFLLPFVLMTGVNLIFGDPPIVHKSISHYYHTKMVDVFVGALCAIGVLLIFYTGYELKDNVAGFVAGISAIGVAFFPTTKSGATSEVGWVHFGFAIIFFLTLVYFSMFLFTKHGETVTEDKKDRNVIYYGCGVVMLICLAVIGVYLIFYQETYPDTNLVFWFETFALIAFSVSWLTKGKLLCPDR